METLWNEIKILEFEREVPCLNEFALSKILWHNVQGEIDWRKVIITWVWKIDNEINVIKEAARKLIDFLWNDMWIECISNR